MTAWGCYSPNSLTDIRFPPLKIVAFVVCLCNQLPSAVVTYQNQGWDYYRGTLRCVHPLAIHFEDHLISVTAAKKQPPHKPQDKPFKKIFIVFFFHYHLVPLYSPFPQQSPHCCLYPWVLFLFRSIPPPPNLRQPPSCHTALYLWVCPHFPR